MFLVAFSVMSVPITHKIRMKDLAHPYAIWQKTQGKYTWVGHVVKNVIELYPIQKSNVVVLLKMLLWSRKFFITLKKTWVFFKIENVPNSCNAKPLCAFTKLSITSFCKKVIKNISAGSLVKKWMLRLTWVEHEQTRVYKMFRCMSIMLLIWFFDPFWDHNVQLNKYIT